MYVFLVFYDVPPGAFQSDFDLAEVQLKLKKFKTMIVLGNTGMEPQRGSETCFKALKKKSLFTLETEIMNFNT